MLECSAWPYSLALFLLFRFVADLRTYFCLKFSGFLRNTASFIACATKRVQAFIQHHLGEWVRVLLWIAVQLSTCPLIFSVRFSNQHHKWTKERLSWRSVYLTHLVFHLFQKQLKDTWTRVKFRSREVAFLWCNPSLSKLDATNTKFDFTRSYANERGLKMTRINQFSLLNPS